MYIKSDAMDGNRVFHGFFDKRGGEAGLLAEQGVKLFTLKQIHSVLCHAVEGWFDGVLQGDALVTDVPDIAIGVYTADCTPVLFFGEKEDGAPVIGAAHAGWRGALAGVIDHTVASLLWHGAKPESIKAVIGPTIAQDSYEVSQEFFDDFLAHDAGNIRFFKAARNEGHHMFDLPAYVTHRLMGCGVAEIDNMRRDTYNDEMDYNSYRRATHQSSEKGRNPKTGLRQMSLIYIKKK